MKEYWLGILKFGAALMHFQAIHGNRARRVDSQPNAVALHGDYLHANVVADDDFLANLSGQH